MLAALSQLPSAQMLPAMQAIAQPRVTRLRAVLGGEAPGAGAMSPTEDDAARVLLVEDGLAVTAARACLSIVIRVSAILQSS